MSAKLFFCGDCHGSFRHVLPAVKKHRPDAVIFLGDLQAQRPLHIELADVRKLTEIFWIAGNHDTDSDPDYDNLFCSELADRNLHCRSVEVAPGVRVAGLAGVFREQVWYPPLKPSYESEADFLRLCGKGNRYRGGLSRKHRSTIFPETVHKLASMRADVLVTHEAIGGIGGHRNGFEEIDVLALAMGVQAVFHGHHHDRLDYERWAAKTGIRAHGVGLRGITDFHGQVVVEGELDEKRGYRQKDIP